MQGGSHASSQPKPPHVPIAKASWTSRRSTKRASEPPSLTMSRRVYNPQAAKTSRLVALSICTYLSSMNVPNQSQHYYTLGYLVNSRSRDIEEKNLKLKQLMHDL
ncbi:hypothetical protein VNO77_15048 [Canavalia gladiata]|uniref:Uncharacterized protein n=1 Tax=Canavalia gladiata TaxID=3824 RepID=A0AAN9LYM0_CANGL